MVTGMEKTYRVLLVHNEYQYAGGEDTVVKQDAELLKKHGHVVFSYIRKNEELNGASVLKKLLLPFTTIFSLRSYREIRKLIRREHIEVVHVHNTLPLVSYSCYFAAKKEKVRLIQTIHNFRLVCPNALFYRDGHICEDCLEKGLFQGVKHSCYRGSKVQTMAVALTLKIHRMLGTFQKPDAYIALTEFNKEKISSVVPPEKIYVKPNYLKLAADIQAEKDLSVNGDLVPDGMPLPYSYFVYAARLEKVKGIFVLLEAFHKWETERKCTGKIPEEQVPKLFLLGTGPDEAAVKAYIERNNMEHVICLGFTAHDKALRLIRHAKAVLYPSLWYEGFPMTIVESLACSTPVIASDTPNLAEKIKDGENGFLFRTSDTAGLCEKLCVVSDMSEEGMADMRKRARQTYESFFTEEIVYDKLMKIYGKGM